MFLVIVRQRQRRFCLLRIGLITTKRPTKQVIDVHSLLEPTNNDRCRAMGLDSNFELPLPTASYSLLTPKEETVIGMEHQK